MLYFVMDGINYCTICDQCVVSIIQSCAIMDSLSMVLTTAGTIKQYTISLYVHVSSHSQSLRSHYCYRQALAV